jgi:hypothetical protein
MLATADVSGIWCENFALIVAEASYMIVGAMLTTMSWPFLFPFLGGLLLLTQTSRRKWRHTMISICPSELLLVATLSDLDQRSAVRSRVSRAFAIFQKFLHWRAALQCYAMAAWHIALVC